MEDRTAFLDLVAETREHSAIFEAAWQNLQGEPEPVYMALGRDVVVGRGPKRGHIRIDAFEYGAAGDRVHRVRGWQTLDIADLEALPLKAPPEAPFAQDRGASLVHSVVEAHHGRLSTQQTSAGRFDEAHRAALEAEVVYRLEQGKPVQVGVEVVSGLLRTQWIYTYDNGTRETLHWRRGLLVGIEYDQAPGPTGRR